MFTHRTCTNIYVGEIDDGTWSFRRRFIDMHQNCQNVFRLANTFLFLGEGCYQMMVVSYC